jgi:hypothetical protein
MASEDFDDLHGLPWWGRWILRPFQILVGIAGCAGFFGFTIFALCFYLAWRSGTPQPVGLRVVQLRDHAEFIYITHAQNRVIDFFKVMSFVGLGIGVPGFFAVQALARWLRNVYSRRAVAGD